MPSIDRRAFVRSSIGTLGGIIAHGTLSNTAHAAEDQADKLHLIWAIDAYAENIGLAMRKNDEVLKAVFSEIWADRVGRFTLDEAGLTSINTPAEILGYCRNLKIGSNDSIFFYYCGHGGWDNRASELGNNSDEKGHFLAMKGGTIYRTELRDAITNRVHRGASIVTDCCSNIAGIEPPKRRIPAVWEGFQDLFFRSRGLTDIQAATRGQFGWSDDNRSGLFTRCFTRLLCEPRKVFRTDGEDGTVSWSDFFPKLRDDTVDLFNATQARAAPRTDGKEDIKDYEAQKPEAFFLSEWPAQQRYLRVKNNTGERLCIWLQYYCYSDNAGWHWRGGDNGLYYELDPGADTGLSETFSGGSWKVRAKKIRYRATTSSVEWNGWWKRDRWIVPLGGYRQSGGDLANWTMTFP